MKEISIPHTCFFFFWFSLVFFLVYLFLIYCFANPDWIFRHGSITADQILLATLKGDGRFRVDTFAFTFDCIITNNILGLDLDHLHGTLQNILLLVEPPRLSFLLETNALLGDITRERYELASIIFNRAS